MYNVERRYPKDMCYRERLIRLSILPLEYRREMNDLTLLFKSKLGCSGIIHSKYFKNVSDSSYRTRNFDPENYRVNYAKQDYLKYSFCNRVVVLWNKLPRDIKTVNSLHTFKSKLQLHYKRKLIEYSLPGVL